MDGTLLKAFFTLGAVVLVLALILIAVRRYTATQLSRGSGGQFRILAQLSVQPKKSICLLLVADKILVVGIADHAIQTLGEISDPDTVHALIESKTQSSLFSRPTPSSDVLSFSSFLRSLTRKPGKPDSI